MGLQIRPVSEMLVGDLRWCGHISACASPWTAALRGVMPSWYQPMWTMWWWPCLVGRGVADGPSWLSGAPALPATLVPLPCVQWESLFSILIDAHSPRLCSGEEVAGSLRASPGHPDLRCWRPGPTPPRVAHSLMLVHSFAECGCFALARGLSDAKAAACSFSLPVGMLPGRRSGLPGSCSVPSTC